MAADMCGANPILAVGSVAFDTIKNPFGEANRVVGGSATYFSLAASFFTDVRLVAVVGEDFAERGAEVFAGRSIDLAGLQTVPGRDLPLEGRVRVRPQPARDHLHQAERVRAVPAGDPRGVSLVAVRVPGQHPSAAAAGGAGPGGLRPAWWRPTP